MKKKIKTKDVLAEGIYTANAKGFGFVTVEGMERDLFIAPDNTGSAMSGDTVRVRLLPGRNGTIDMTGKGSESHRQEAEVVDVLIRAVTTLVGTYEKENGHGVVIPDNRKIQAKIFVTYKKSMKAVNGHKVVCRITDYGSFGSGPEGEITQILGHMDDPGVDILSIIKAYDLPGDFPEDVKKQLKKVPDHVDYDAMLEKARAKSEKTGDPAILKNAQREDWRDHVIVTIDGPDTKDIDDAISVERDGEDYVLGVHIADVANYVFEGTALDKEALNRATSVYLVDRVIPMLPHELSNGICSLNQGEDRLALSCIMRINKKGDVVSSRVVETVIRSRAKLSYPGVMNVFNGDDSEIVRALSMQGIEKGLKTRTSEIVSMLKRGLKLSHILEKKRSAEGSINFEFAESDIILDENGRPKDIVPHERNAATELIENFMVMANSVVAETFNKAALPFVYRTHGAPSAEKIYQLSSFIRNYGYRLKFDEYEGVAPKDIQKLLEKLKGTPEENMISVMTLRSMQRAAYTTSCDGHFGLALKYYCHFTSPIRRYPDLQIHRIIKEYLHGKLNEKEMKRYDAVLPSVCSHSSENERRADEAERETDRQKKAEYMAMHIGEEYDGVVSGVTGWGLYVELQSTVEGMVPVSSIKDDYYVFDQDRCILYGERKGAEYMLGQKVKIKVAGADTVTRTIDFELVNDGKADKRASKIHGKVRKADKADIAGKTGKAGKTAVKENGKTAGAERAGKKEYTKPKKLTFKGKARKGGKRGRRKTR